MAIDENYCLSVDHLGRPVDIYHDPDYVLKCIGYWKENLRSYLITYDDLDPLSVRSTIDILIRILGMNNKLTTVPLISSSLANRNTDAGCIRELISIEF